VDARSLHNFVVQNIKQLGEPWFEIYIFCLLAFLITAVGLVLERGNSVSLWATAGDVANLGRKFDFAVVRSVNWVLLIGIALFVCCFGGLWILNRRPDVQGFAIGLWR